MTNLLLIGNGKWGQKYITTLSSFPHVNLRIANRDNWRALIDDKPDGVMICTPPSSHIDLAVYSLERHIPTMIEKPLSLSVIDASRLSQFDAPILVNHIHLFSEAFQNLRKYIKNYSIDRILSLDFGNGPDREYSSLWDYGCHDLAMILDLTDEMPQNISVQELKTETGTLFRLKMQFSNFDTESLVGNGGQHRVCKFKADCGGLKLVYNAYDCPAYHAQPLENALRVFIGSILGEHDYRLGLDTSLKVLKVLELCQNQLLSVHH